MSPRGRLIVTPGGPWRLYQHIELPGWEMLGTVQRGGDVGALARNTLSGQLCMLRGGAASTLDQRKVLAALQTARAV
ncbi:hypothetical protein [Delftia sp. DT-2]|jgi:hypothetical protein|uniref:hypothetical protein n=1 Tax=Delftia sp. DT-2 TaxID=3022772 RepID=UPI00233E9DEB|nr:hypothetical protein [Delftia sp. DT-2]MDC2861085.1 hypothetical protein [Delftia sp. DT-2]